MCLGECVLSIVHFRAFIEAPSGSNVLHPGISSPVPGAPTFNKRDELLLQQKLLAQQQRCMHARTHARTHAHSRAHTHKHTHTNARARAHTHTHREVEAAAKLAAARALGG